ncbi:hypothetical protein RUND412_009776 [Rhizina undulata]
MVLHQNKWDRKATRAHVRKLKAKGKEDDTKKPQGQGKRGDWKRGTEEVAKESGESSDDYDEEREDEPEDANENGASLENKKAVGEENNEKDEDKEPERSGTFSRRKVQSNSWRYEEEDEEFPAKGGSHEEEDQAPEPEPDYVSMTIERKGQLKDPEEANKEKFDETFLKEKNELFVSRRGGGHQTQTSSKGKVVKVDRREFEDVTQKIAKQSIADAFRQRFAPKKAKSGVVPGGSRLSEDGRNVDDIDTFLGELNFGDLPSRRTHIEEEGRGAGSREIRSGHGRSYTSDEQKHSKDDDWLDSMLNGR